MLTFFQLSEEEVFVGAAADYALLFLYYSALLMCYVLYLCFTGRSEKEAFIVGGMSRSEGGGVNGGDSSLSSASTETHGCQVLFPNLFLS
jgi:hypothetical protein